MRGEEPRRARMSGTTFYETVFEIDYASLATRIGEVPDEVGAVLRLFDGTRTLRGFMKASAFSDADALRVFGKLCRDGILVQHRERRRDAGSEDEELRAWLGEADAVAENPEPIAKRSYKWIVAAAMATAAVLGGVVAATTMRRAQAPRPPIAARPVAVVAPPPPPSPLPPARTRAPDEKLLLLLARHQLDRGALAAAIASCQRAIAIDPKNAEAYLILGAAQQQRAHSRESRAAYQIYLRLAPGGRFASEVRAVLRAMR
jgi:tetratricopeptide (TPR) repeat protein